MGVAGDRSELIRTALEELVAGGLLSPPKVRGAPLVLDRDGLRAELDARGEGGTRLLAVLRLRNLSPVNELFGYAAGDLLRELGIRVAAAILGEADPEARMAEAAGSQLVLLFATVDSTVALGAVEKLRDALAMATLRWPGGELRPRAVLALLELPVDARHGAEDTLRLLHAARRLAEQAEGGFAHVLDDGSLLESIRAREEKIGEVMGALDEGHIEVYFQPLHHLETGEIVAMEALARIQGKERVLEAEEFVGTVHELGRVPRLDALVLARVGEQASRLASVARRLLVNVSPLSLADAGFRREMDEALEELRRQGFAVGLVLELTEQALVEHLGVVQEIHRRHGVSFAVDDFGTGYSSLQLVTRLAVEGVISMLKIDGSLIRPVAEREEAYKVVLAITQLAKSLDLEVVAEHVENEAILERLRAAGITLGQGFLMSAPMPLEELLQRSGSAGALAVPPRPRTRVHLLEPYLQKALRAFYDRLLSDPHFVPYFESDAQVAGLIERQRASFVAALDESDEEVAARYVELGRLHFELGLPFPTFLKGSEILLDELLEVLGPVDRDGAAVRATLRFFRDLGNHMARGYLERILEADGEEWRALAETRRSTPVWSALQPLREAMARAVRSPDAAALGSFASALGTAETELAPTGRSGPLRLEGESLAYFLERGEHAFVLLSYARLKGLFLALLLRG